MSAKDDAIIKKMRAANIPPSTYGTTLEREGYHSLREQIDGRTFKRADDHSYKSYVIHADGETEEDATRAFNATGLFAKELVLMGAPVYLMTIVSLAMELRLYDYTVDDDDRINPIFGRQGNGYIVIPDFDRYSVIEKASNQRESMDWLAQHVQRGGGLVVGCPKYRPVLRTEHHTFADVASRFLEFKV